MFALTSPGHWSGGHTISMHPKFALLKSSLCKLMVTFCLNGSVSSEEFNQKEQKIAEIANRIIEKHRH